MAKGGKREGSGRPKNGYETVVIFSRVPKDIEVEILDFIKKRKSEYIKNLKPCKT